MRRIRNAAAPKLYDVWTRLFIEHLIELVFCGIHLGLAGMRRNTPASVAKPGPYLNLPKFNHKFLDSHPHGNSL